MHNFLSKPLSYRAFLIASAVALYFNFIEDSAIMCWRDFQQMYESQKVNI